LHNDLETHKVEEPREGVVLADLSEAEGSPEMAVTAMPAGRINQPHHR